MTNRRKTVSRDICDCAEVQPTLLHEPVPLQSAVRRRNPMTLPMIPPGGEPYGALVVPVGFPLHDPANASVVR